jgi:peroxiredoxin
MSRSSLFVPLAAVLALAVSGLRPAPAADRAVPEKAPAGRAGVGDPAPDFTLTDTQGKVYSLSDFTKDGKTVVLEWFNPDCPFVRKQREKTRNMAETAALAEKEGVVWLLINSGAPGKQGYGLERNKKAIEDYKIAQPVLLDESGEVGKAYGAKTTPDMYVIVKGTIVYEGAIDDRPDTQELGKTNYVKNALMNLKAGKPVDPAETKPYGCSVKYAS